MEWKKRNLWQPSCRNKKKNKTKKTKKKNKQSKKSGTLLFNTHFDGPLHRISKKSWQVQQIHYNNFFFFFLRIIIIIYINSNIAALVQYYPSKGKLNANNLFFGNFMLFWIYLLLFDCDATIFFFPFIFDNFVVIILFSFLSHFRQFGCYSWFFPFKHFFFGHFINLGIQFRAEGILIISLSKFNSFLTPLSHHFSLLSNPFLLEFRQWDCRNLLISSISQIILNGTHITNKLDFLQYSVKRVQINFF